MAHGGDKGWQGVSRLSAGGEGFEWGRAGAFGEARIFIKPAGRRSAILVSGFRGHKGNGQWSRYILSPNLVFLH